MNSLLILLLLVSASVGIGYIGRSDKYGFFLISLFLTPVVGLICVYTTDRR